MYLFKKILNKLAKLLYSHCIYFYGVFLLALLFCNKDVIAQSPDTVPSKKVPLYFGEQLYWKGPISVIPHSLYRGSGLALDGSFLLGESNALRRIDFKNGKEQTLIESEKPEEYAFASVVSPNNKQIAFLWFNGEYWDLRISSSTIKNGNISQSRLLVKGSANKSAWPYDWSPDGKWILTRLSEKENNKIALVSVKDGSIKVIKDIGEYGCNKISFSPDGKYIVYDANRPGWKSDLVLCRTDGKNEQTIIKDSGYAPYWSPTGNCILFLSKQNSNTDLWNIWALPMQKTKAVGQPMLIKEGIDFFAPLGFTRNGSFLYGLRSPIKLNVYVAELNEENLTGKGAPQLVSTRFPDWNLDPSWSPNGKLLAYNSRNEKGQDIIVLRSADTGNEDPISASSGSILQWFPDNTSLLVMGQDNNGLVPLYRFNLESKDTTFLFSLKSSFHQNSLDIEENPILSHDGKSIYFIEKNRNTSSSKVFSYVLATGDRKSIVTFDSPDITSFSASPDGKYLSAIVLYQGQAGRPSAIRIVSLPGGETHDLLKEPWGDPTKFFGLGWSPDSRYVYYVRLNHKTSFHGLWRIDVLGGQPQNTGIYMTDLRMPKIHPDGKHLVFFGGEGWYRATYEVRAIKITSNPN